MFFAMCWQPLDILWHAFQAPVDYTYRFSYIVTTWMILLALRGLSKLGKPRLYQLMIAFFIPILCWIFVFIKHSKKLDYLTVPNMIATLIFMILTFGVIVWILECHNKKFKEIHLTEIAELLLLFLMIGECGYNGYQSLKSIGFAQANTYTDFVANLDHDITWISNREKSTDFYRIGKTFQRSENDSINVGYRGMSGFTSTQNTAVTGFMNSMGQLII